MRRVERVASAKHNRSLRLDGARCIEARQRLGFSRDALSNRAMGAHPLSVATIKRAEQGQSIYLGTASRLADILQVPLHELLAATDSDARQALEASEPRLAAIAVLPFRPWGDDAGYFADGLAEDLLTRLSRWWFPVISRSSAFGPTSPEIPQIGEELGADYIVSGSARRDRDQVRVSIRLALASNGQLLWANSYDRQLANIFAAQDELTNAMVNSISTCVLEKEARRHTRREPSDMNAWDLGLLGTWHFHRRRCADNLAARELFERALHLDKHLPLAWYYLVMTHQQEILHQWTEEPRAVLSRLDVISREFDSLYPNEAHSHVAAAYVDVYSGRRQAAMARLTEAIDIDPNLCAAYSLFGQTLAMANEPDRALEQFEVALRLSPRDSERWAIHLAMGLSHFVAERYCEAIDYAEQAIPICPNAAFAYSVLASAHALLGDIAAAQDALARMHVLEPRVSLGGFSAIAASAEPEINARYFNGLKLAGLGR